MTSAGGTEGTGILTAEEEAADLGVLEQVVAFPSHGDLARDQDVADIREIESHLGVLLDHQDGLSLSMLEVVEDLEDHADIAGLEADRGLVYKQDLGLHDQGSGDFEQPPLAA